MCGDRPDWLRGGNPHMEDRQVWLHCLHGSVLWCNLYFSWDRAPNCGNASWCSADFCPNPTKFSLTVDCSHWTAFSCQVSFRVLFSHVFLGPVFSCLFGPSYMWNLLMHLYSVFEQVTISFAKILLQVTRPRTAILGKVPRTTVYRNILQYPEATKVPGILIVRVDSAIYFSNSNYVKERHAHQFHDVKVSLSQSLKFQALKSILSFLQDTEMVDGWGRTSKSSVPAQHTIPYCRNVTLVNSRLSYSPSYSFPLSHVQRSMLFN